MARVAMAPVVFLVYLGQSARPSLLLPQDSHNPEACPDRYFIIGTQVEMPMPAMGQRMVFDFSPDSLHLRASSIDYLYGMCWFRCRYDALGAGELYRLP